MHDSDVWLELLTFCIKTRLCGLILVPTKKRKKKRKKEKGKDKKEKRGY